MCSEGWKIHRNNEEESGMKVLLHSDDITSLQRRILASKYGTG